MLWGYFYFPQLQLDILQQVQSCDQPLVIVDGHSNHVVQLNELAIAQGIKKQMGLATAASLYHQLQVIPYHETTEQQALIHIVESLYDLVADIAVDEVNGVFIRFGNMLKLYKGLDGLKQSLLARLADINLCFSYASAYSPIAAKVLAKSSLNQFYTEEEQLNVELERLAITQVFESTKDQEQLARLGIKRLAQLNQISFGELSKRFSHSFLSYFLQLQGKQPLAITFYQPKPRFAQEIELLYEISTIDILLKPLAGLLKRLASFLVLRGLACQMLTLRCRYRSSDIVCWDIRSAEFCDNADKWHQLVSLQLEKVQLKEPVVSIGLFCEQLTLKVVTPQVLFGQRQSQLTQLELMSLLQAKLGIDKVKRPTFCSEHRPELANQMSTTLTESSAASAEQLIANMRPSYLLATPQPLTCSIDVIHGPERIETGWWQHSVIRDYFIARNGQGQWCWVYREPNQQWFIHGYFG
ncbi:DNA polymerase Y family protein [Thalassotalea sp. M1531]|uniref:DNA polymerase Y family protein n=1 Tax=Thalassotalea algicola TaxID=2716224 RepID=A0A7Y0LBW0_9GAMM|nr:DNA polymerase Y family protein [Thalassotalea algicola]NMP31343.1 DNA polymerase Y family protein [Thalassotalea algicola]